MALSSTENRPGSIYWWCGQHGGGGGGGGAPLLSILTELVESGEHRPVGSFRGHDRGVIFVMLDRIEDLGSRLSDFRFIPALSGPGVESDWTGETGFHSMRFKRHLQGELLNVEADAFPAVLHR